MILAAIVLGFAMSMLVGTRTGAMSPRSRLLIVALTILEVGLMLYAVYTMEEPPPL
jgi:hypothetical protein